MKPVTDVVNAVGELIGRLTLPGREKKELEAEILKLVYDREREMAEAQASVLREEAAGNWLQRSWRPLVMLTFAVGVYKFADPGGFFPVLGFAGNRVGRIYCREKRGENVVGYRAKTTLIY